MTNLTSWKTPVDAVAEIVNRLENGRHVILSFGRFEAEEDYLLVSNILTQRIRDKWVKGDRDLQRAAPAAAPRPLVIVVEGGPQAAQPWPRARRPLGR